MSNNAPVYEVKIGRVRGTVWANESENGTWYAVAFSKLYKDRDDKWQDSVYFSKEDLPLLIKAADQLHTWLYQPVEKEEGP